MGKAYFKNGRISNRLKGYDYRNEGYYYVTICTDSHQEYFGIVEKSMVVLTQMGEIAHQCWLNIPRHFKNVQIDKFIIMPNHIHGIIRIKCQNDICRDTAPNTGFSTCRVPLPKPKNGKIIQKPFKFEKFGKPGFGSLSTIIRSYKSAVTRICHRDGFKYFAWQKNYYDHILRSKNELIAIRKYIKNNPHQWHN